MGNENPRGPLANHLIEIEKKCKEGDPTIQDIINILGEDGHYVLIFIFSLPFLTPMPTLGLSAPFGFTIAVVACLALFGKPPWIPRRWSNRQVSAKTVASIAEGSEKVFKKISFFVHPRWGFLFGGTFRPFNTFLIAVSAVLLALPLPVPGSNAAPAWLILFQAIAHLEEDGLFIVISYLQAAITLVFFYFIAVGFESGMSYFS